MKLADQLATGALEALVTARVRQEPVSHVESVISEALRALVEGGIVGVAEGLGDAVGVAVAEGVGVGVGVNVGVGVAVALVVGDADGRPFTVNAAGTREPLMHTPVSL